MKHWFKDQHFRSLLKNSSYLGASRRSLRRLPASRRWPSPAAALGAGAVRHADPDHQLRQGGQRDQQVPVVAADRPLRRPGADQRRQPRISRRRPASPSRSTSSAGSAACSSAVAAAAVHRAHGSASRPNICGSRCSIARCCRPWARRPRSACCARSIGSISSAGRAPTYPITRAILAAIACAIGRAASRSMSPSGTSPISPATSISGSSPGASCGGAACSQGIRPTLRPRTLPGAWRFAIHVNLTSSVQAAWGPIARLVVGGLLGPAGAALFRVASSLADSAPEARGPARQGLLSGSRPDGPRNQEAVEADASRHGARAALAAARDRSSCCSAGRPLVGLLFGKEFIGAYPMR